MAKGKKLIREKFRDAVFKRDGYQCVFCGESSHLDAHHITDRTLMPNGGYVIEHGITLCTQHHQMAEWFHQFGTSIAGFSPEDLYTKINSSLERATNASSNLRH
jgi:5-methylcytosine-specific restriction endonuclease McrA